MTSIDRRARPATSPTNGDGGNGGARGDFERLIRLEADVKNLKENMATKTDLANLKVWFLRWFVVAPLCGAVVALVVRSFVP